MKLSDAELEKLVTYPGYGGGTVDPTKVEMLIIGNESGAGGTRSLEEYVRSVLEPGRIVENWPSKNVQSISQFLQYIARLNLFLAYKNDKWFSPKSQLERADRDRINNDWANAGKVHLVDIRPLPRRSENRSEFKYEGIDINRYLSAFNNFDCKAEGILGKMVSMRKEALKGQIERFTNLKIIVAPGSESMKIKFFESLYEGIKFDTKATINPTRKINGELVHDNFHIANYNNGVTQFTIVVCKFFNSRNGIRLAGLKELAEQLSCIPSKGE